jgi:hypothetical protein
MRPYVECAVDVVGGHRASGNASDTETFGLKDLEPGDVPDTVFGDSRPHGLGIEDEIASRHGVQVEDIKAPTMRDVRGGAVVSLDADWL